MPARRAWTCSWTASPCAAATGPNDRPGGSEQLDWAWWDVRELMGKTAVLRIIDTHTGGWGHINVDQIVQSDTKRGLEPIKRDIVFNGRYLTPAGEARRSAAAGQVHARRAQPERLRHPASRRPARRRLLGLHRTAADPRADATRSRRSCPPARRLETITQSDDPPAADDDVPREGPAAIPFHVAARLAERPQRTGLARGGVPPVLPAQPLRLGLGQHALGPRRQPGPAALDRAAEAISPREYRRLGIFRQRCGRPRVTRRAGRPGHADPMVAAFTSTGRGECIATTATTGGRKPGPSIEGNPVVKHQGRDPRLLWHKPDEALGHGGVRRDSQASNGSPSIRRPT